MRFVILIVREGGRDADSIGLYNKLTNKYNFIVFFKLLIVSQTRFIFFSRLIKVSKREYKCY